jgi:hypothetical protein
LGWATVRCCQSGAKGRYYNLPTIFGEKNMSTPQDDHQPVVWAVLVAVILLAVGLALGFGIAKSKKASPAAAAVTAPAAEAAAPGADATAPAAGAAPTAAPVAEAPAAK